MVRRAERTLGLGGGARDRVEDSDTVPCKPRDPIPETPSVSGRNGEPDGQPVAVPHRG
jgi:hypothetical protein